jgi:hypothetical protein
VSSSLDGEWENLITSLIVSEKAVDDVKSCLLMSQVKFAEDLKIRSDCVTCFIARVLEKDLSSYSMLFHYVWQNWLKAYLPDAGDPF